MMRGFANCDDGSLPVTPVEVPRFDASQTEELKNYFFENGYVVIREVADQTQVAHAKDLLWKFLHESNKSHVRGDPATWDNWVGSSSTGILFSHGIGQSEYLWYLRGLPKVKTAFSAIWDESDLIVSFDGANIFRPWKQRPHWRTVGGWYHVDQNGLKRPDLEAIQGLVTLYDCTPSSGGFVVVPQSQTHHLQACKRAGCDQASHDFVPIPPTDPLFATCKPILVVCKAGDLVLWDSRTVHCNKPGVEQQQQQQQQQQQSGGLTAAFSRLFSSRQQQQELDFIRAVGYVCMVPRRKASEEVLCRRREAVDLAITTSHWPQDFVISSRMTREGDPPLPRKFEFTPEQLALI